MSIAVFFTDGVSLTTWDQAGMLERELALYHRLLPYVGEISLITYGNDQDTRYSKQLAGIRVLHNRWGLPRRVYRRAAALTHLRHLAAASIWKTNQASGAVAALPAKRIFRKPLIVRAGFLWSRHVALEYGNDSDAARNVYKLERRYYRAADAAVVTESSMKDFIVERHGIPAERVRVIPNYVDTELFAPTHNKSDDGRTICFVGRLTTQKNLTALFEALKDLDIRLRLAGGGEDRAKLEALAEEFGLNVEFLGNVPHANLPALFASSTLFILPSLWEGNPKALLEAMAAGMPVIGCRSPGIENIISNGDNGLLCGTTAPEIRDVVQQLLSDRELQKRVGEAARKYTLANVSLDQVVDLEIGLYADLGLRMA